MFGRRIANFIHVSGFIPQKADLTEKALAFASAFSGAGAFVEYCVARRVRPPSSKQDRLNNPNRCAIGLIKCINCTFVNKLSSDMVVSMGVLAFEG